MKATSRTKQAVGRSNKAEAASGGTRGFSEIKSRWAVAGLTFCSFVLMSLVFAPISWWPLSFVALVPWLTAVCLSSRAGWAYWMSYALGVVFLLWNLRWLTPVTGLGYVALAFYSGLLFPVICLPLRHVIRRRRLSLTVVFPVLWVASELPRATHTLGFPWFFLAHSLYKVGPMIQISDLGGAHCVSFVIAMVNGWIVDQLIGPARAATGSGWRPGLRFDAKTISVIATVTGTLVYGYWRLNQNTIHPGPRVAVVQETFPSFVSAKERKSAPNVFEKAAAYFRNIEGSLPEKPDLIVLPESPWPMALNEDFLSTASEKVFSRLCHDKFSKISGESGAYILTGGTSFEQFPNNVYPKEKQYNSSFLYEPGKAYPLRYDKVHLVLFGEYVPLRYGRFHQVYLWLNGLTPWGKNGYEYSLTAGTTFHSFEMQAASQGGQVYRFGTPICYEDVIPYCSRRFVAGKDDSKGVDFLINISNDGWFPKDSGEREQHMAVCVFRAIEHRVGIARAVNTGRSGFIDPNGRIHDTVPIWTSGRKVATIEIDTRYTLYTRWGDVFAYVCVMLSVFMLIDAVIVRRIFRVSAASEKEVRA